MFVEERFLLLAPIDTYAEVGKLQLNLNEVGFGRVAVDGVVINCTRVVLDIVPGERVKARLEVMA